LIVDLQLKSKIALVTGSTAGIGFAIGSGLPGEGATVINGRSKKTSIRQSKRFAKDILKPISKPAPAI
jgi:NAD(P)-dependent dehydrogenase (short-subunit alcohol dehydrogenase family)